MRRMSRADRRHWYIDPVPQYYRWDGEWHYFGRPGFNGGRYNGGSFGPCWTRTPIGRCGIAGDEGGDACNDAGASNALYSTTVPP